MPTEDVTGLYRDVICLNDVDELLRLQIAHFFDHYKDLESGKWVNIKGWGSAEDAFAEINDAVARFNSAEDKPNF